MPDTQWADGEVLDAKTHAHGLSALLWELMERGELCFSPSVCVVLLGLGSGANAILSFASTFLVHEKFAPLRDSTRFLALVNPFPSAALDASVEVQQIKRRLQALKRTLERGVYREQLECLVGAMFSAGHLEKVSESPGTNFSVSMMNILDKAPPHEDSGPTTSWYLRRSLCPTPAWLAKLCCNTSTLLCVPG